MHYSEHFKYKYSQTSYYCFINVRIKSKVVQKINCEGNQIREICSSVHLDVWSSRSPKKYDPVWLWMHASTLTDWWSCSGAWWKYYHMHCVHQSFIAASFASWLLWGLQGWQLDEKYRKNNTNNAMTMDMCLSICFVMKHKQFSITFNPINKTSVKFVGLTLNFYQKETQKGHRNYCRISTILFCPEKSLSQHGMLHL